MTASKTHTLLRSFWEGTPAFHAGFLVVVAIFASLLNVGVLLVFLAARWLVEVSERVIAGTSLYRSLLLSLQTSLVDVALLLFTLCIELLLPDHLVLAAENSSLTALWAVFIGLGTILPKFIVLLRSFAQMFASRQALLHERGGLGIAEGFAIFVLVVEAVLLLLSPQLTAGRAVHFLTVLRRSLAPWRW